jgi:hypothetical protein
VGKKEKKVSYRVGKKDRERERKDRERKREKR